MEFAADYIAFDLKNPSAAVGIVQGIHMDFYKNYKIYYVVEDNVIIIIRILHMLVDSRAWLYRTFGLED